MFWYFYINTICCFGSTNWKHYKEPDTPVTVALADFVLFLLIYISTKLLLKPCIIRLQIQSCLLAVIVSTMCHVILKAQRYLYTNLLK